MTPSSSNRQEPKPAISGTQRTACACALLLLIGADQLTKYAVRSHMAAGESIALIPGRLHLSYIQNSGAAFSLFPDQPLVTIGLPIAAIVIFAALLHRWLRRGERLACAGAILVLAGGIGNLTDRLCLGYVTDMIDFRVFPVFNLADICVTCGSVLMMVAVLRMDGTEDL